ncbi:uncharacterized protein SCHCODRAFT_02671029 [Schizophyllum commune H4-8]|uniref:Uncharacterized protein n=1 Tax=Schizophyllum commune (strain H4-8 / FGSC 9210) TaxID=578458 RepID=D8QE69_SCHCM|nr:uncharacterized protein SCHCODRAFT_02671029 [Schizophyllum commune H4-8]KAI5888422.1 hypothetical protein SCHCODRAFT_02671029 [Schizophyllum commune H4-8]
MELPPTRVAGAAEWDGRQLTTARASDWCERHYATIAIQAGPPPAVLSPDEEVFFDVCEGRHIPRQTYPTTGISSTTLASPEPAASKGKKKAAAAKAKQASRLARAQYSSDDDEYNPSNVEKAIVSANIAIAQPTAASLNGTGKKLRKRAPSIPPFPNYEDLRPVKRTRQPEAMPVLRIRDVGVQTEGADIIWGWYGAEAASRAKLREDNHFPPMPFPDATHYVVEEASVVLFKNDLAPDIFEAVWPKDKWLRMRVAGFSRQGTHIIMSPNASYIPYFPEKPEESVRWAVHEDGLYGAQEYTRVPCKHNAREGHSLYCAFIPRRPLDRKDPTSIFWHDVSYWFIPAPDPLIDREDRYLLKPYIADALKEPVKSICSLLRKITKASIHYGEKSMKEDLGMSDEEIRDALLKESLGPDDDRHVSNEHLDKYYKTLMAGHPYLDGLEVAIRHLYGYLQIHGMPLVQCQLAARELQRYCLEGWGIVNQTVAHNENIEHHQDFNPANPLRWVVGAFTDDFFTMKYLAECRVPVWRSEVFGGPNGMAYDMKWSNFVNVPSVERLVTMTSPYRMVCLLPHPERLPYVFKGTFSDSGWLAKVHAYSSIQFSVNVPLDTTMNEDEDPLWARPSIKDREASKLRSVDYLRSVRAPDPPPANPFEAAESFADDENIPTVEVLPVEDRPLPAIEGVDTTLDDHQDDNEDREALAYSTIDVDAISSRESSAGVEIVESVNPARNNQAAEVIDVDMLPMSVHDFEGTIDVDMLPDTEPLDQGTAAVEVAPASVTPPPEGREDSPPLSSGAAATTASTPPGPGAPANIPPPPIASTAASGAFSSTSAAAAPSQPWGRSQAHVQQRIPKGIHTNPKQWVTSTYDHQKALPSTTLAWDAAKAAWTQSWSHGGAREGDAKRCFPLPRTLVSGKDESKRVAMVHMFILMNNMLLENARETDWDDDLDSTRRAANAPMPWKLSNSDWRLVLFAEHTMNANPTGPTKNALEAIEGIFGGKVNLELLVHKMQLPYVIHGEEVSHGQMPGPATLKTILWRLQEVLFRKDWIDLNQRMSVTIMNRAEQEERLQQIFDPATVIAGDLLTVRGNGEQQLGLVASEWRVRARYVRAMVKIMAGWSPPIWDCVIRVAQLNHLTRSQAVWLEEQASMFYTRCLWGELYRELVPPPIRSSAEL